MSTRDGTAWFDQLKLTDELRPYVGRPAITLRELLHQGFKGERHYLQQALTRSEMQQYTDLDVYGMALDSPLTPLSTSWPMGHSFSAAIAQYAMLGTILESGVEHVQMSSTEREYAAPDGTSVAPALDDVNFFERGPRDTLDNRASPAEALDGV